MEAYLNLLQDILDNGTAKGDRTRHRDHIGVRRTEIRLNLFRRFPAFTTKRIHIRL